MRHAGIDLANRLGAAKAADLLARFEWGALSPGTLPPSAPVLLALLPPVVAGLLIFKVHALAVLGIAATAALLVGVGRRLLRLPAEFPLLAVAVTSLALVGPGANLVWVAGVGLGACILEVGRARLLPAARLSVGLLAYSIALLASRGAIAAYLRPPNFQPGPEPISLWLHFFPPSAAPIDAVRLYVGNVAGPVFATSLLAVVVSLCWLWYTRRLSLVLLGGVLVGALVPALVLHWNPVFQLDSGPLWLVAGVPVADRMLLKHSQPVQALMGLAAGLGGVGLRSRGVGIEAVAVAAVGIQVAVGLTEGAFWLWRRRRVLTSRIPGWWARVRRIRLGAPRSRPADRPVSD